MSQTQRECRTAIQHKMFWDLSQLRPKLLLGGRQDMEMRFKWLHALEFAPRQRGHTALVAMMPKCPGFDIEDPRWRIVQYLGKSAVSQQSLCNANILQVAISHHLRDEAQSILEPFLGLAPPKNFPCHRKQLFPKVLGNRFGSLQGCCFHELNHNNLWIPIQVFELRLRAFRLAYIWLSTSLLISALPSRPGSLLTFSC